MGERRAATVAPPQIAEIGGLQFRSIPEHLEYAWYAKEKRAAVFVECLEEFADAKTVVQNYAATNREEWCHENREAARVVHRRVYLHAITRQLVRKKDNSSLYFSQLTGFSLSVPLRNKRHEPGKLLSVGIPDPQASS